MKSTRLKLVNQAEPSIDIGALNRAEILERDWDAAAVWADRQKAVWLPDVRKVRRR
jgi:hypothetical protein